MKITEWENKTNQPNFWTDPGRVKVLRKLSLYQNKKDQWERIVKYWEEIYALNDLLEEDLDEDLLQEFEKKAAFLEREIEKLQLEALLGGRYDQANAILSVHPGAGGVDSCDWAEMLLRTYLNWSEKKGYRVRIVDWLEGAEAGIKNATAVIEGRFAYGYLKEEVGIHRLIRISPFDAAHRRHTSFTAVDVIPETEEGEVEIKEEDLRIETFRAGGPGGQHVNTTDSAVRISHLPTGIVVQCQDQRSQHKNKATALRILKSRLYSLRELEKQRNIQQRYQEKARIEWGNQVRSYFLHPYTLVKDHRTGLETSDVWSVINGNLDKFINASLKQKLSTEFSSPLREAQEPNKQNDNNYA